MVEFLKLKQHLSESFFSVLALIGDDQWLKKRSIQLIKQSLDIDNAEMNIINLEKPDIDDIMLACATDSFFSRHKLVIVDGFVFPMGKRQQEARQRLASFAKSSQDFCCLVFVVEPKDTRLFDIDGVTTVNCNKLPSKEVEKWILSYVKKQGKSMTTEAAGKLAEYCLCDMARLNTEVEKLCCFPSEEITTKILDDLVFKDTEFLVFDLGKAIANGDAQKALEMTQSLQNHGEEIRSLFAVLYSFFRRLYYIRTNKDSAEIQAQQLSVKTGAINFAKNFAMKYKPLHLKKALEYFRDCDTKLKLFHNENDVFNLLIFRLLTLSK